MSAFSLHSQHCFTLTDNTAEMLSGKNLFLLISMSLVVHLALSTSAHKLKRASGWDPKTYVMIFNQKIEFLTGRVDRMETNLKKTIDVHEIITNITQLIVRLNDENANKFEEKFKYIEENLKKNDENFKKSEKCEEKLNKIESILLELKNGSDDGSKRRSDGVWRGVRSLCEDKVATWANATPLQLKANLDRIDFLIENEQKTPNPCLNNPCLHGRRCQINSTGSGYACECPKFRSGIHCENVECSAEKSCWRLKDTSVIETELTWYEAKANCESLNMTLAMPKDEERTLFLRDRLRLIYKPQGYYYLWMGLKRDEGMSKGQWEWVDGSALGWYVGGRESIKSLTGSRYSIFHLDKESEIWGYSDAAARCYSICETHIFAILVSIFDNH